MQQAWFLIFKNRDIFRAYVLRNIINSILAMISFPASAAAVVTHFQTLFKVSYKKLNLALKARESNSTAKEMSTWRLTSTVLSTPEFETTNKGNEEKTKTPKILKRRE